MIFDLSEPLSDNERGQRLAGRDWPAGLAAGWK